MTLGFGVRGSQRPGTISSARGHPIKRSYRDRELTVPKGPILLDRLLSTSPRGRAERQVCCCPPRRFLRCSSGLSQGAVRKVKSRRSSVSRRRSAESTHPRIFSTVPVRRDETWLDGLRAKMKESFSSLAPSIHLVVVRPSRKSRAFRYESVYPQLQHGMWQIPVARF